ncbi:hypothetical protein GCM10020295_24660 [Streptomyces cinereospinus]
MSEAVIHPATAGHGLLASLDPLLRDWLPRQRWFAGKGRPVTGFSPVAITELLPPSRPSAPAEQAGTSAGRPGLWHLLVQVHQPAAPVPGPGRLPAPGDCYQLLIGAREALPPRLAPALIGHVTEGPLAGHTVYEALHDPRPAEVLLEALRTRARVGDLRFERDPHQEIRSGLVSRAVTAEQSNSSVIYGDTFILKLLRRVVPGVNPDLELPLALAREGCPRDAGADGVARGGAGRAVVRPRRPPALRPGAPPTAGSWPCGSWPRARTSAPRRGPSAGPPPRCTWRWPAPCRPSPSATPRCARWPTA